MNNINGIVKINDEMKGYAVLVFVSEYAKQLPYKTYVKERDKAYKRQMYRAYTDIKGDKKKQILFMI